jgi:hypothetical protein
MFQGELMRCTHCGREQQSDPAVESGWYNLLINGQRQYLCPPCLHQPWVPQCPRCQRFYSARYAACPWCKTSEKG